MGKPTEPGYFSFLEFWIYKCQAFLQAITLFRKYTNLKQISITFKHESFCQEE